MIKETYFAIAKRLPDNVHKEFVMRGRFNSVLAPSWSLINAFKEKAMSWQEYAQKYKNEILNNPLAIKRIKELIALSKTKDVFLICYEKNKECHRFILIDIITHITQGE